MKSVLISIKPEWCELIASGKKTVEVRKTKPKIDVPFKCYIYQTKAKDKLVKVMKDGDSLYGETYHGEPVFIKTFGKHYWDEGNGKVIGEFVCDKIYDITPHFDTPTFPNQYICGWDYGKEFDCLSFEELTSYLNGKQGYGWHISNLVIYDEPKELGEFKKPCNSNKTCGFCDRHNPFTHLCRNEVTRPPQSYMFVEELGV